MIDEMEDQCDIDYDMLEEQINDQIVSNKNQIIAKEPIS